MQENFSWLPLALMLTGAAVPLSGCTRADLADEWALTVEQLQGAPLELVDFFPADGTTGVAYRVQPYLLLNRPLHDDEARRLELGRVVDLESGLETTGPLEVDSDGAGLTFEPDDLYRHRSYLLDVPLPTSDMGTGAETSTFETLQPSGASFNMSSGLKVEQFGGNSSHATVLQDIFIPGVYPLWVLELQDAEELGPGESSSPSAAPHTVDLSFAPALLDEEADEPFALHRDFGFVARLDSVEVDADGRFDHRQAGVFLPLWSADSVILLYLDDVRLSGRLNLDDGRPGFDSLRLEGTLGTRWLLRLAEEGPAWRSAVDVLEPDVDTNGNNRPDAASFVLSSSPEPIELSQIDL